MLQTKQRVLRGGISMMHMNTMGLISIGFKMVAKYVCITKGEKAWYIECYTNGTEYLVRQFKSGGHAWDLIYTDKNKANAKVVSVRNQYSFYKKIK